MPREEQPPPFPPEPTHICLDCGEQFIDEAVMPAGCPACESTDIKSWDQYLADLAETMLDA